MTDTLSTPQAAPRRMEPDSRRAAILQAAITLSVRDGYLCLNRESAAAEAGVSPGLVSRYYYSTVLLRSAVMQAAVDQRLLSVIAEGIATRVPEALSASPELRAAALASLASEVAV